jgi:hypothetical protein
MLMSRHQNTGKNHNLKIASGFSEDVTNFKHLETTVAMKNFVHEEIKSRLNSDNACYNSVQTEAFVFSSAVRV